jgi:acyl carrier protein
MATAKVEAEVIDLLAEERGLLRDNILLNSRLLQDLGMDGDDAIDFFLEINKRFGTDLAPLYERWTDHFGPEGVSCWISLLAIPATALGVFAAASLDLSNWWAGGLALTFLGLLLWAFNKRGPRDHMVPITVGSVIEAVEAGEWPKS